MVKTEKYGEHGYATFTKDQAKIIDSLIGTHGSTRADVVRTITICWLTEKSLIPNIRGKK